MRKIHSREHYSFVAEYLKHLTTLSTGSIVILVTFLEKVFAQPRWKALIIASLLCFMFSVIGSVVAYSMLLLPSTSIDDSKFEAASSESVANIWAVGILITWMGFLLGVICLTIFAIRNFIQ